MTVSKAGTVMVCALVAASCSGSSSSVALASCKAGSTSRVALAAGGYASLDPAASNGCVTIAANTSTTDSAEYVIVAQATGGNPGDTTAFQLQTSTLSAQVVPQLAVASRAAPSLQTERPADVRGPAAVQFDRFLRNVAITRATPAGAVRRAAVAPPPVAAAPPVVGNVRKFKVCATLVCSRFDSVTAVARAVQGHVAIYLDVLDSTSLAQADIDTLASVFEQHIYEVDTTAFGRESDIDNNSVVIALMTETVNKLVTITQCNTSGYIAGFFYSPDIDPTFSTSFNHGEVMYTLVPDPGGALSCAHTVSSVKQSLPSTLLHELEHMINFNQHVLQHGGSAEAIWLDEALAKYAEELGGRTFLPDSVTFGYYVKGDIYDASQYLLATANHFLITPTDQDLADVGAGWLFMRFVIDQFGDSVARKLVQTSLTGPNNVGVQTQQAFAATDAQWALAIWVSDLAGFTPATALQYKSLSLRKAIAWQYSLDPRNFPSSFPLVPTVLPAAQINVGGKLRAGGGVYIRALEGPSAPDVNLLFSGPGNVALPAAMAPRLTIVRIR